MLSKLSRFGIGGSLGVAMMLIFCAGTTVTAGEEQASVVTEIKVSGCVTLSPQQVKAVMGTREGKALQEKVLDDDFQRLNRMDAIADAQIRKEAVDGGVRLLVVIREKDLIRRIQFSGNRHVRESQLEKLIQCKVGSRYDPGTVNNDIRAIEDKYREDFYYFAKIVAKLEPFEDGIRLVYDIEENGRVFVDKIVFRGNHSFGRKELFKYMETRENSFFTRGKYDRRSFEKDLERLRMFYKSKGYLDVSITERPFEVRTGKGAVFGGKRSNAVIYVDIEEGEAYRVGRVTVEGNQLVETGKIMDLLETTPGEVFSPITAQKDANRVRDEYGKYPSSRYFTKVWGERVYTERGAVVDVIFHVKESDPVVVSDVQILGLEKTKDFVPRRVIEVMPGEKIDSEKINWSKRNLRNQGYYKNVNFQVLPGDDEGKQAKVVVDLEEQETGKLVLGAGISTRESFVGSVQLSQKNFDMRDMPQSWKDLFLGKAFKGAGQHMNINISAGEKSENYSIGFVEPWLFGKPISLSTGAFHKTYEWDRYDEQRTGGYIGLGKKLFGNRHLSGGITYRLENVTLEDFDKDSTSAELLKEEGSNTISRVILNLTYDSRDSRFDPTEGFYASAKQEFAGTVFGGDRDFWRSFLDASYFHPIFKDKQGRPWVLALRGDMAAAEAFGDDQHVPVYERMYLGGIGSVRGFAYHSISPRDNRGDVIGGELSTSYSAEFFVPIYENVIRLSAFFDIGAVWKQIDKDNDEDNPWRSSTGLGLHVKTPLGPMPIRLYWIHHLDEVTGDETESFQFTFGAFF